MKKFCFVACAVFLLGWANSEDLSNKLFPESFKFGAAGASYQIEGAWNEDGKGESIWDKFIHDNHSRVADGSSGDVACDSYHKYKEDVQNLVKLGAKIYRFSLSWPRILPDGTTKKINEVGVQYYINLLEELKRNNIEPLITLYHWDLPQYLEDLGGWLNPQIADYFAAYARIAFERFGPYTKYWLTLNEPVTTCSSGYGQGEMAPGKTLISDGIYQCFHVQNLAHAKAYHVYDKEFRATQQGKVAVNLAQSWIEPKNASDPKDLEATERAIAFSSLGFLAWPVYKGDWHPVLKERVAKRSKEQGYTFSRLPEFTEDEKKLINSTSDFLALNMYTSSIVQWADDWQGPPSIWLDQNTNNLVNESWPESASFWLRSYPPGLRKLLGQINTEFNPGEIIITENGWSDKGELNDTGRIDYIKGHLDSVIRAIQDGVNVTAYTHWSIMDNFEWSQGYTQRFGLIHVDFSSPNRTRTWKESAKYYQNVIATRCLVESCEN